MSQPPSTTPSPAHDQQRQFPCARCGASLAYSPGTSTLQCPYCGTRNTIPQAPSLVREHDYLSELRVLAAASEALHEVLVVKCNACGADVRFAQDVTASKCPFCGSAIVATAVSRKLIKPQYLLPFAITRPQASAAFRQWLAGRWFAPGDLRKLAESESLDGVYLPYWTYDADTTTRYTGMRGDDYWTTETYTSYENGRPVTRTRQVLRTRWSAASGVVADRFNDLLVPGTGALPQDYLDRLEPWDLDDLGPYSDEYLSGFVAHSYDVDLPGGFELAKALMVPTIRRTICQDIGGDHQQIHSTDTDYDHLSYKHLLLPVWLSAYRYHQRPYLFLINARTGEVQGQRPYSWIKIALLILCLAVMLLIIVGFLYNRSG